MAWKSKDEDGEIKLQITCVLSYEDRQKIQGMIDCDFSYVSEADYALLESISSQRLLKEVLENKGVTLITLAERLIKMLNADSKDIKSMLSVITFVLSIFNVPAKIGNPTKDTADMISLSDIGRYLEERDGNDIHQ